jgi:hypothetical protein
MTRKETALIRAALKWHCVAVLTCRRWTEADRMLSRAATALLKAQPKDTWPYLKKKA